MQAKARSALVLGAAAALVAIGILLTYSLAASATPSYMSVNGQTYAYENATLSSNPPSSSFVFLGSTFRFDRACGAAIATELVCGNVTEPGHGVYSFSFSDGLPIPSPAWQTWIAPDRSVGVQYEQGGNVHLLVRSP